MLPVLVTVSHFQGHGRLKPIIVAVLSFGSTEPLLFLFKFLFFFQEPIVPSSTNLELWDSKTAYEG